MPNKQHVDITDPYIHEPKGVATAASNQVYVADGAASGDWTQVTPSNRVMIHSASDFPTASGGVRTLAANTVYQVVGSVDIGSDRLVMSSNTVLMGTNQDYDTVVSATTGALITATDVNSRLIQIGLTVASGTLWNVDGTGVESFDCIRVNAVCDTIGDVDNMDVVDVFRSSFDAASAGMTFTGAFGDVEIEDSKVDVAATNATCVDLGTATFDHIHFNNVEFVNPTGTGYGLDVAAAGANLNSGKLGLISDCTFADTSNASNYVAGAIRWIVESSPGVAPSTPAATGYITGNATATTFSGTGAGNDVVANFGTSFNAGSIQRKFTTANTGITTYNGTLTTLLKVNFNLTGIIAGGASRTYNFYIAKNGTIIDSSISQQAFDGTNSRAISCAALVEVVNGDTISLRIRAETATTSITVSNASLTIVGADQ